MQGVILAAGRGVRLKPITLARSKAMAPVLGKPIVERVMDNLVANGLDDLIHDPHLEASGFWQEADHPDEGRIRMSSPPMNFSGTPASIRRLAPRLGQHSVEVLREAGFDEDVIQQMLAAGETREPGN